MGLQNSNEYRNQVIAFSIETLFIR